MKPVVLMILDGFGLAAAGEGNAITSAKTPNLSRLMAQYPTTQLAASGLDVGLPEGQMGNSEVGHTNIGAGRVVYQELTRISKAIVDGDFFENPALFAAMTDCKTLHLMGLLSDGGVHSHQSHLHALLAMAKQNGVERVCIHCFLDGRDTGPKSGLGFLTQLEGYLKELSFGEIATVTGRYYAMDRDNRWERVKIGFDAIVEGSGTAVATGIVDAVAQSYQAGINDEFIRPIISPQYSGMEDGDSVIFFNFRPDRARELTRALVDPAFLGFEARQPQFKSFVCMTSYDATMPAVQVAYAPQSLENTLGEVAEQHDLHQLRIAETEKYAHVTFFFNGGVEEPLSHESRILIPSPQVATYDLQPQMSAPLVTEKVLEQLQAQTQQLIILNYANCDMVGHTGVLAAAMQAVEAVDACVGQVVEQVLQLGGAAIITADHGNADVMLDAENSPMTAHSTNPVPFILASKESFTLRTGGILADIAPTVLQLLELPKPMEMTGISLIQPMRAIQ